MYVWRGGGEVRSRKDPTMGSGRRRRGGPMGMGTLIRNAQVSPIFFQGSMQKTVGEGMVFTEVPMGERGGGGGGGGDGR